jgi:uncharacterized protein (DUF58 family)
MDLLDPKILDRIGNYPLLSRTVVDGFISGLHQSQFHGFGNEFVQYRNYVAGDDLKYLDWKVYARSRQLCSKVFREETNMNCRIIMDCSASMQYKGDSSLLSKIQYASSAVACLAYLVSRQGDKVGFYAYGNELLSAVPQGSGQRHVQEIFRQMSKIKAEGEGSHKACLTKISDGFKGRGLVIFISDMLEGEDEINQFLKAMRFSNNDCLLLQVLDRDEIDFPFSKNVRFVEMEGGSETITAPELIRESYQRKLQEHLQNIKETCQRNQVDYQLLNSMDSLDHVLAAYLNKRQELR